METGSEMLLNLFLRAEEERARKEEENKIKIQKKFYNKPTQVRFFEPNNKEYCYGIAYHDVIICACCGSVFNPAGLREIQELSWVAFDYYLSYGEKEEK